MDSKSFQISKIHWNIQNVHDNAVAFIVSIFPLISDLLFLFLSFWELFPDVPTTTGIIFTLTFHSSFFSYLARSQCFSIFSLSFILLRSLLVTEKSLRGHIPHLFVNFDIPIGIGWSVFITTSQRKLWVSFSWTDPATLSFLILTSFSHQWWRMGFHWCLSDTMSPQVSKTFSMFWTILML